MALKGDLASVDLAQVFQMLALNQKVGMLSIQGPTTWKALYFDHRGVTLYYNEHLALDRVLASMARSGQLRAESVQEARDHAANQGTTVVDSLLAGGFLNETDLEEGFRREIEEEVYDLFFWRDARFEFFEGATAFEGREGTLNDRFFFTTDSLIMEAARRIDEWAFIQERVSGPQEVFRPVDDNPNVLKVDDVVLSVLELVDGKRNVERLIEVTGLSPFQTHKSLAVLLEEGLIEQVAPTELVAAAQESMAEGRLQDAINLYERAVSLSVGLPDTHTLVAQAYEATEQFQLATYHLKCVAEYYASNHNVAQAVKLLRRVIEMIPTDLAARERVVELMVGAAEFRNGQHDPVAEGKVLIDLYLEIGELERVRSILERLLRDNPSDLELKKSLINVHTRVGDTRRVMELYESIAEDFARRSQPIEAVKYLQKVLTIDRGRRDISDRIRSLYELDERRRIRRRSLMVLGALFCVIAALGGGWYLYERHAQEHFDRLDASSLLAKQDFTTAASLYRTFLESYPFTLVSRDAHAQIARIEGLRLAHQAQIKRTQAAAEAKRNRLRTRYRLEWDRYQTEFKAGNLASALEHIESVRNLVTEVGGDSDAQWAEKMQLERCVSDLRVYIGEAAALERTARELLARGEWRQAREKLVELTSRYDMTEVAKRARIPVLIGSRPSGAQILKDGQLLTRPAETGEVPLTTPAVVYCAAHAVEQFELRAGRCQPTLITVDARAGAESVHVLTIVAEVAANFDAPPHTGVAIANGQLVVGVRGGRLGIANSATGQTLGVIQLPELREVQGDPVVVGDRIVFRVSEPELWCCGLPGGERLWTVLLESVPAHDPIVRDSRVLFGDVNGKLHCFDLDGKALWSHDVGSQFGGRPTVQHRYVRVGTQAGDVMLFDLINGNVVRHHQGLPGVSTAVLTHSGVAVFGGLDSTVTAIHEAGGRVLWSTSIGRVAKEGELAIVDGAVLALGASNALVRLNLRDGRNEASLPLAGRVVSGPVVNEHAIYLVVREEVEKGVEQDCLLAIDAEKLGLLWEFRDGGLFRGPVVADRKAVYVPGSGTDVLRFQ